MAGSSTYPETVDNKTALQDGVDYMEADNVNNAYVPINKTQIFLGANGKGASWSSDVLDYLANEAAPLCTKTNTTTLSVSAGTVFIKNSGQTHRLMRRNTIATSVTIANLDTGTTVSANTMYFIFAVADTAASTFTVKISTSASSPTGLTNFELIGWFFNEASGSVLDVPSGFVSNVIANGRHVPNVVTRSGTSAGITLNDTSYGSDLDAILVRIYTSGRPVEVTALIKISANAAVDDEIHMIVDVDGTDKDGSENRQNAQVTGGTVYSSFTMTWTEVLSAGAHIIKIQGKVASSNITIDSWNITAKEL